MAGGFRGQERFLETGEWSYRCHSYRYRPGFQCNWLRLCRFCSAQRPQGWISCDRKTGAWGFPRSFLINTQWPTPNPFSKAGGKQPFALLDCSYQGRTYRFETPTPLTMPHQRMSLLSTSGLTSLDCAPAAAEQL